MNSNKPISEQYRLAALEWAKLNGAASMLEEGKTTYLAQQKAALGDIPDSHAERLVKAKPEWAEYIKAMVNARQEANKARANMDWLKMKFSEWQSEAADRRSEKRL